MNPLSSLKIERNKILIPFFIFICVLVSVSTLFLLEPCDGGMGCMVLIIPFGIALPALPLFYFIQWVLHSVSYYYDSWYFIPSFLKFIPIPIIFAYTFLLGFLLIHKIIKIRSKNDLQEEKDFKLKHVKQKFKIYYFLFTILSILFVFIIAPPVPFVSDQQIIKVCDYNRNCINNFLHYRLANCNKETSFFFYPLKINLPKVDGCILDNFITQKPLKNTYLYQDINGFGDGDYFILEGDDSSLKKVKESLTTPMDKVLDFFASNSSFALNNDKKIAFCESFNKKQDIKISNADYCMLKLEVNLDNSDRQKTMCEYNLTKIVWNATAFQKSCLEKILDFKVYFPNESLLNSMFGDSKWAYADYNKIKFIKDKGGFIYDLSVLTNSELMGNSDVVRIRELSVNNEWYSSYYRYMLSLDNQILWTNTGETVEVASVNKVNFKGIDIYIQNIKNTQHYLLDGIETDKVLKEYSNFNFIKGNTFVLIDGQTYKGNDRNEVFMKIAESIIEM